MGPRRGRCSDSRIGSRPKGRWRRVVDQEGNRIFRPAKVLGWDVCLTGRSGSGPARTESYDYYTVSAVGTKTGWQVEEKRSPKPSVGDDPSEQHPAAVFEREIYRHHPCEMRGKTNWRFEAWFSCGRLHTGETVRMGRRGGRGVRKRPDAGAG